MTLELHKLAKQTVNIAKKRGEYPSLSCRKIRAVCIEETDALIGSQICQTIASSSGYFGGGAIGQKDNFLLFTEACHKRPIDDAALVNPNKLTR